MHVSMTVQTSNTDVTVNDNTLETYVNANLAIAGGMLRVIKRMAQAMDVDFEQLIKDVVGVLAPDDRWLQQAARKWPLYISKHDEPYDDIVVYCGDDECPLDVENSEILRLPVNEQGMYDNTTIKDLEDAIMRHIELRRERENEITVESTQNSL